MRNIELFPPEVLALQQEIRNHPNLLKIIEANAHAGFPYLFGVVGEYCGILLDGVYSPADIIRLSDIMVKKLKEKGAIELRNPGKIVVDDASGSGIILPPGFQKDIH